MKGPLIVSEFNKHWNNTAITFKCSLILNLTKIFKLVLGLLNAHRRTDRAVLTGITQGC